MLWVKGREKTKDAGKPNERQLARKRCVYIWERRTAWGEARKSKI